jgi:hypothetical protein
VDTSPLTVRRLFNTLVVRRCSQTHGFPTALSVLAVERLRSFSGIPSVPSVGAEPAAQGKSAMWEFPTTGLIWFRIGTSGRLLWTL